MDLEAAARAFGVPLALIRCAQLPADVRERLGHLEQRAVALRQGARSVQEATRALRQAVAYLQHTVAERRQDVRHRQEDEAAAEALVALLEAEAVRSAEAAEAAQARAADAGRVAENLREHLGLTGGNAIYDRSRGVAA